jgi:ammonium transporter, Amt family
MSRTFLSLLALLFIGGLSTASAESAHAVAERNPADYSFIILTAALVFIMQAGFCLLEIGLTRSKNTVNAVMKNVADFGVSTLAYFVVGFGLMFGATHSGVLGWSNILSSDYASGDHPVWAFWVFQAMFSGAAVTICAGAIAERTFFLGYMIYGIVCGAVIYPILGHWCWGGQGAAFGFGDGVGWLAAMGFHDFAGSTVVHAMGGACALAGIVVAGPRLGRFAKDGTPRMITAHNIGLTALGVLLLWFGWFGFNSGSALAANVSIGRIMSNTLIAGCAGMTVGMLTFWVRHGWADPATTLNGALGGAVAITAGCDCVTPVSALLIGCIAGFIMTFGPTLVQKMRLDDAVDAIPTHLMNGTWGTLAVSVFNEKGAFTGFSTQLIGVLSVVAAAFGVSYVVFQVIDKTIGFRASDEQQRQGLDFAEHSTNAYPEFMIAQTHLSEDS